jgi:SAM-dependent methyltransferase
MSDTAAPLVHPGNADAARAWDGPDGEHWAAHERRYDQALGRYEQRFIDAARLTVTDTVLDVGCGTGQTTRHAAQRAPQGWALGVDLSARLLERARQRAGEEGVANARFLQADAQIHPFAPHSFDAAISRTGAMFFGDPVAAFTNIGGGLRPSGRLVLLVWQPYARNERIVAITAALAGGRDLSGPGPDAPGAFSLGDPDRVDTILRAAGYSDIGVDAVEEQMYLGDDADDAEAFVHTLGYTVSVLRALDQDGRRRAGAALRATLDAHDTGRGVWYPSAMWLVTARR